MPCRARVTHRRFTYSFTFMASKGNFYDIKRFAMIPHKLFRVLSSDGYWSLDGGLQAGKLRLLVGNSIMKAVSSIV